ncbi:MAG: FGGY-family carbohydrate kinase, partial [Leucobacter sp.]
MSMAAAASAPVAAIDLGATSGRVMIGELRGGRVHLDAVHRFPNGAVPLEQVEPGAGSDGTGPSGALAWDVDELWRQIRHGLREAFRLRPGIASIGVDSWGVDFALMRGDERLGPIRHYRDPRNAIAMRRMEQRIGRRELFAENGLQIIPLNSVFQLEAERDEDRLAHSDGFLMVPDYVHFLLTGERSNEWTIASTSGLVAVGARPGDADPWSAPLLAEVGMTGSLHRVVQPGETVGRLLPALAAEFGAAGPVEVVAVASHDTASAVAAIPLASARTAYISCGTWGLVGVELPDAVVSQAALDGGFSNERGIDGTVRLLKNVTGTWLISESMRHWQGQGIEASLEDLIAEGEALAGPVPVFDTGDPGFTPPGDIPDRVVTAVAEQDPAAAARLAGRPAAILRSIIESLAASLAAAVHEAARVSGLAVDSVHMVGGGSQGELLCRRTAELSGLPVVAG